MADVADAAQQQPTPVEAQVQPQADVQQQQQAQPEQAQQAPADPAVAAPAAASADVPAPAHHGQAAANGGGDAAGAAAAPDAAAAAAVAAAAAADDASRKRRSRWAPAPAAPAAPAPAAAGAEQGAGDLDENGQPRKRSRWSKAPPLPDAAAAALTTLTPEQIESFKIQLRIDELSRLLHQPAEALRMHEEAREAAGRRSRSPSPEPLYDANGVRTNTRVIRFAIRMEKERQQLVEALQKLNPAYKPPSGFRKIRYERRLLIPIKEYPDYNFIGMIIGPRGNTQKRMEKESGCKIVIRGRGSQKEGRAQARPSPEDNEDLHVLISGDDEMRVIATTKEVEKLLVPIDETKNEHKARQLRELAVINGTLRDEIICRMCGMAGHRQLECPQRNQNWTPANIRCNICGSDMHPSQDCPQRFQRTAEQAAREMDSEYSSFMGEILGEGAVPTRSAQPLYLTDGASGGGGAGGAEGGSSRSLPPAADRPGYGGDRGGPPHQSGGYSGDSRDRGGDRGGYSSSGSRVVRGADPRETYREFRPANAAALAASASLPAISHRDGFRDAAPVDRYGGPPPPPQHGGYGGPPPHHGGYGGPPHHGGDRGYHAVPPPWAGGGGGGGGGYRGGPPPPHHYGGPPPRGGGGAAWVSSSGPRGPPGAAPYDQHAPPPGGWHQPPPPPPPGY